MKNSAALLTSGTNFRGSNNKKARKIFEAKDESTALGEFTDYKVLDSYEVTADGPAPPAPMQDWHLLPDSIQSVLLSSKFTQPTPIQKYCYPCLTENRHLIALSPTGSGKTLAYILPLLDLLKTNPKNELSSIILVPTRELATQVHRQFLRFSEASPVNVQLLRKNRSFPKCQIIIATPKRLMETGYRHSKPSSEEHVDFSSVRYVILDEADSLLTYSFVPQTDAVLAALPRKGVTYALFSATMTPRVEETAASFMPNAVRIQVGSDHAVAAQIDQELKFVGNEKGKVLELRQRLAAGALELPAVIFVMNKQRAYDLCRELGHDATVLTSEESDQERAAAIRRVRTGEARMLITTDLGGRGIDLAAVQTVVNFDMPPNSTIYTHRIGRTARAGRSGKALTLFTVDDQPNLRPVAVVMKRCGCHVEDWMLRKPDRAHTGARALFEPQKRKTISSRLWKNAKVRVPKADLPPEIDE